MLEVKGSNIFKYFEMIQERTVYRHKHTYVLISPFLFLLLSVATYLCKGGLGAKVQAANISSQEV